MFVSTYSTYINRSSLEKSIKEKTESSNDSFSRFETKASHLETKTPQNAASTFHKLPLDYISEYKALSNQQKLHKELSQVPEGKNRFSKIRTLAQAQEAYMQNATLFVLSRKPKLSLDQTPSLQDIPQDILKRKMISTYIANENYYHKCSA